jgi:hypothetical protein
MFERPKQRLRAAPWRTITKVLVWFVIAFMLLVGVPTAGVHYTDFGTFVVDVAVHGLVALVLALYGLAIFTFIWARSDVPAGWENTKRFVREFPENWRSFWRGVGAVLIFLIGLPGMLWRGLLAALRMVTSLPARWRAVPSRDKKATGAMAVGFAVIGTVGYFLWPTAAHVVGWLPDWVVDRRHDSFMFTLIVDTFMSGLATIFGVTILRILVDLGMLLFRRNAK